MAVPVAAAEAGRLAAIGTPDGEKYMVELSPMKLPAKPGFVPLSPGPEKAKLHMDAVASLLGLSAVEQEGAKEAIRPVSHPAVPTDPEPSLDQWTILASSSNTTSTTFRVAKRLTSSEIYTRSLSLPRVMFESLFGKQSGHPLSVNALIEPREGQLLALAAESLNAGKTFSLRAGPLINALKASAGSVLLLTAALNVEGSKSPPRARASLGYPADALINPSSNNNNSKINKINANRAVSAAVELKKFSGSDEVDALNPNNSNDNQIIKGIGHESRSASGSPGSLDSLTQVAEGIETGEFDDLDDQAANGSNANDGLDPEWEQRSGSIRTRGRPRKRKPFATLTGIPGSGGSAAQRSAANANLSCCHCGTRETPRWWKDAFPLGTLCNACGIWLKRHGYPRPVQFFSVPSAASTPPSVTTTAVAAATAAGRAGSQTPSPTDFYLINGRPKRRRSSVVAHIDSSVDHTSAMMAVMAASHHQQAMDAGINYQAAGGRAFVMRRKLITNEVTGAVSAALVHFGWAPGTRAAHEMFDRVSAYVPTHPSVTVEDFELLGATKATATLTLQGVGNGGEKEGNVGVPIGKEEWDALVRHFVEQL